MLLIVSVAGEKRARNFNFFLTGEAEFCTTCDTEQGKKIENSKMSKKLDLLKTCQKRMRN